MARKGNQAQKSSADIFLKNYLGKIEHAMSKAKNNMVIHEEGDKEAWEYARAKNAFLAAWKNVLTRGIPIEEAGFVSTCEPFAWKEMLRLCFVNPHGDKILAKQKKALLVKLVEILNHAWKWRSDHVMYRYPNTLGEFVIFFCGYKMCLERNKPERNLETWELLCRFTDSICHREKVISDVAAKITRQLNGEEKMSVWSCQAKNWKNQDTIRYMMAFAEQTV